MATAYFIYTRYYDFDKNYISIGGVQTYIKGLMPVFKSLGFSCVVYQTGTQNRSIELEDGTLVCEENTSAQKNRNEQIKQLVSAIMKEYNDSEDMLIFLANEIACENTASRSIALQHGISWDWLTDLNLSKPRLLAHYCVKAKDSYKIIDNLKHVKRLVCVDHNFPNWLRSTAVKCETPFTVIPNFTDISEICEKPTDKINIIFARRFFPYRGTRIFAPAIKRVLEKYGNVYVTIAGSGPDEELIKEELKGYEDRVNITEYAVSETLDMHKDKHIAVVPTIMSEGTSLSLLEAMSAQCAVVCTDVGGLSNIVIDGFNGVFCEPTVEDVAEKISELVENEEKRRVISKNAYESVKNGFSYEIWQERWKKVIKSMMGA